MKTILFSLLAFAITTINLNASTEGGKKEKVTVHTTAQCEACVNRITTAVNAIEGVKSVRFNDVKETTVTFDPAKTNADAVRTAITAVGYDVDGNPGNAEAYAALPSCCQKGGHP